MFRAFVAGEEGKEKQKPPPQHIVTLVLGILIWNLIHQITYQLKKKEESSD